MATVPTATRSSISVKPPSRREAARRGREGHPRFMKTCVSY
jgi:hypothetical protein